MSEEVVSSVKLRYIKMTARKMRCVVNDIRRVSVKKAFSVLSVHHKKAASYVEQALKGAVANVQNNKKKDFDIDVLFIKEIMVDEGPTVKRWTPRAMGKASPILKRTSHLSLKLGLLEGKI